MKNKRNRLQIISEILRSTLVGSQEELLDFERATVRSNASNFIARLKTTKGG